MESKSSRYQSRILREMRQNTENPFSPPSSTGSHGTVTLTSQLSNIPDGESTRQPMLPVLNTSVLGRTFPEWDSKGGKENKQPSSPGINNDAESVFGATSPRLRPHQQVPIVEDTMELNAPRGNVTTLLDTLNKARSESARVEEESNKRSSSYISPKSQPNTTFTANAARRVHRQSHLQNISNMSVLTVNQTARSFFLPNLNHLTDFVSGTLRWSSMKNGTPIFVKHGRVYDRENKTPDHHADFEAVTISRDEEKIFVSLDKIREEIQTLQEHDEFVSKQAEQLQEEICELQSHVTKLKSRKDSAMGSESDSSLLVQLNTQKSQLEDQVSSLKTRLDQANRKISLNEIHNQSFVAERDEALQKASDHVATIKRLQARNDAITEQKLELQRALKDSEEELDSERELLDNLHQKYEMVAEEKSLLKEDNLGLERQNEDLFNNNKLLQQKNALLERENNTLQEKVARLQELVDGLNKKLTQKTETRQQTQESRGFMPGTGKSKLTKMAHRELEDRFTVVSEMSAKTSTSHMDLPKQDNYTRESDHTRESRRQFTHESKVSMPVTGKSKLTKMAHREPGDRHNTVVSEMSARTMTSQTDLQMQDDYTQQIDLTQEPQLDSDEENMTSALFIDDITLESNKKFGRKQKTKSTPAVRVLSPILSVVEPTTQTEQAAAGKQKENAPPVLTQSAKRVLNTLCQDHECYNCMVCTRIKSHRHEPNGKCGKKTVRIDRPVPATDRVKSPIASAHEYEDQHTLRPSQDPAIALAKVMKGLKDEERHIRTAIARKQAVYDECDPSVNKRLWKQLDAEIKGLRKRRDLKRDQIYDLHDVLEGQKANAQLMSQEAIDMTITSVLSRDPTWNGIMDC
ncbi:hypothetical protein HD806DRAFT_492901 [Xylariaceae sp. AK1471]|nr:hypothetical protein HD806DRAFT_492901 [Xylariaceae sp. AK1471]